MSGRARTDGSGSRDHGPLQTQTWPQRRPPLPPTAPCPAAGSGRQHSSASGGGGPAPVAGPGPARPGVHYGKCSSQCTAAARWGGAPGPGRDLGGA